MLRYFDYVFTGVFTFEMVIKVRTEVGLPQAFLRMRGIHQVWREGGGGVGEIRAVRLGSDWEDWCTHQEVRAVEEGPRQKDSA